MTASFVKEKPILAISSSVIFIILFASKLVLVALLTVIVFVREPERDIRACSLDRDDRGVLVCVGVGAVPGFVGGDGGGGEGGERLEGAGDRLK